MYHVAGDRRLLVDGDGDNRSEGHVYAKDLPGRKAPQRVLCDFLLDPAQPKDLQNVQPLQVFRCKCII